MVFTAVIYEATVRTLVLTWSQTQKTFFTGSLITGSRDGICFAFTHYILKTSAMF